MSKNLQEIANDVLKRYPNEKTVYITSDGQAFFDKSHAMNHARRNRTGKELKMETFEREEKGTKSDMVKTVKEISEILKKATAEEVGEIITAEQAMGSDARTTVFAAAEKRLKELNAKQQ